MATAVGGVLGTIAVLMVVIVIVVAVAYVVYQFLDKRRKGKAKHNYGNS